MVYVLLAHYHLLGLSFSWGLGGSKCFLIKRPATTGDGEEGKNNERGHAINTCQYHDRNMTWALRNIHKQPTWRISWVQLSFQASRYFIQCPRHFPNDRMKKDRWSPTAGARPRLGAENSFPCHRWWFPAAHPFERSRARLSWALPGAN